MLLALRIFEIVPGEIFDNLECLAPLLSKGIRSAER
jgi:hypothetical protein